MKKQAFLDELKKKLSAYSQKDADERVRFYAEVIDDYMDEGLSEEEATSRIGSVDEILAQIVAEGDFESTKQEKIHLKRKLTAGQITLIALGSPIWFSLLLSAFSVVLSLYITLWALVISLWAIFISFAVCAPATVIAGVVFACQGHFATGFIAVATALVVAGLAIFLFFACRCATKGVVALHKTTANAIQKRFTKKEEL